MKEVKVHIRHLMLWKFKNNKNSTETSKKMASIYGQGVITDSQIRNWFSKFCSGDKWTQTRTLIRPWLRCSKWIGSMQPTQKYSRIITLHSFTICNHLKKIRKLSNPGVCVPRTLIEKNKKDCISIVTSLPSRILLQVLKNVSIMTMFNAKGSGLRRKNLCSQSKDSASW